MSADRVSENVIQLRQELPPEVTLVAVSKTRPSCDVMSAYHAGQRDFGENRVQELVEKAGELPKDIRWHQIGHLQTNKVRAIVPFVHLIHAADSPRLLAEIAKRARANALDRPSAAGGAKIAVLLQVHIAQEEHKFGWTPEALKAWLARGEAQALDDGIELRGLMGMATNTSETAQLTKEFSGLRRLFEEIKSGRPQFDTLSMGMSGDWRVAVDSGSTMIRVGSSIFGKR
jgi:pyridoxal phosphate enzyme (YggS family)